MDLSDPNGCIACDGFMVGVWTNLQFRSNLGSVRALGKFDKLAGIIYVNKHHCNSIMQTTMKR